MPIQEETIEQVNLATSKYKYGFSTSLEVDKAPKGLTEDTIRLISSKKEETNFKTKMEEGLQHRQHYRFFCGCWTYCI